MALQIAEVGTKPYDQGAFDRLDQYAKAQEAGGLAGQDFAPGGKVSTLGEASLKYYGTKTYWPILRWVNAAVLPKNVTRDTPLSQQLHLTAIFINRRV
jgi:hypothetical protein